MFDDLDDLLEDVPQHNKSKPSIGGSSNSGGGKLASQVNLANKRPQTAKAADPDEFEWD